jgi:hypothetical protein
MQVKLQKRKSYKSCVSVGKFLILSLPPQCSLKEEEFHFWPDSGSRHIIPSVILPSVYDSQGPCTRYMYIILGSYGRHTSTFFTFLLRCPPTYVHYVCIS